MIELMGHQQRAVEIGREHPRYGFLWDCGSGKTIALLAVIGDQKRLGFRGKTLVIAPKSILWSAWGGDAKHFPNLKTEIVWSNKPTQRKAMILGSDADVLVTNPETFKTHISDFLAAGVTRLVVDESSKIKCYNSQISQACHRFSDRMRSVYILSGTPAPNDRTEYWSQLRCVDPALFGNSFHRFAATYFYPIKRMIGGKERVIGWNPIEIHEPEFFERLRSKTWSLSKEDCVDLPEQTDIIRDVKLSPPEFKAYHSMRVACIAQLATGQAVQANVGAMVMKLRQITGGAIYDEDRSVVAIGDSKLDEMESIISDEIGERQVVVWAEFTSEIDRIVERLQKMGRTVGTIDGRARAEQRGRLIEAFQAGSVSCLVCQPQAAGHGITLTAASYAIYYSHGYSFEGYKQSRDRIHRTGQRNPCTYYHLTATGTVDEKIMRALGEKRDAHEDVMSILSESAADGD